MFFEKRANATPKPLPPKPLVLKPSGTFEGDDGKWSTFNINIAGDGGGKGQNFKVLISTSSPIALIPAQTEWCKNDCPKRRGIMSVNGQQQLGFDDTSPAWSRAGLYNLPFNTNTTYWWSQDLLLPETNGTLNGEWGLTTVGLGEASAQSITLLKQYVAMYYFKDFFLGYLGLSVGTVGPAGAVRPTFFSSLALANDTIASNSYGFTAGAFYRK